MLAPVDLRADSPLVIRTEQPGPIVAEGGLDRRANLPHPADLLGAAAPDVFGLVDAVRDRRIARGRRRVLREAEPSHAHVPDGIGRRRVRQMTEIDRRHRRVERWVASQRLGRRRRFGVGPELIVKALHQLPARSQAPGELREDLVLLVFPRKVRIGAWLTVGVAKVLVSGEEPQSIANHRAAEAGREVTIPLALVAGLQVPCTGDRSDRLARQRAVCAVVRRVRSKAVAAGFGDDVHDGALDIAVLDRRAHGLDLQFLNEVDARIGPRDAVAWAR